ncbi:Methyltransferase domain-containing protein [Amycolatopsis arida]|uniref:Methyltransferase domain-containing protein n=1 Tax=Amycolatopsis arida TaxID=587909 RepID=A0A1I5SLF4_9PSEU|nr:class I SAM-dependent methyltransferase [Amycolatopsis arida]TDX96450.1 methyltransferase family protein [Amycolatopsis arida]SFP71166.1 Methyltransferase domain-containing protein [Amycolatopsis arida]
MQFDHFDARGYPTVDVRTGYGEWVATYERTVEDTMDIALLERLAEPAWADATHAVDLGCGTGRTGAWLRGKGVPAIDGVDLTPEMLAAARGRGAHDRLVEADVTATGLPASRYDLLVASLIDEHLPDLRPLYREAWRIAAPKAVLALVAFHPQFIMVAGMPTHYTNAAGEPIAIATHVHLVSDHVTAALAAGWRLAELREGVVDDAWLAVKPKWARFRHHPVSAAYVWRKET